MLCPICKSGSFLDRKHPEVDIYRCPQCDHCFSDMNSLRSQERYRAQYYESDHKNWFANPNTELFENIFAAIHAGGRTLSLMDVGCGKGDFLRYLRKKDPHLRLAGIDLTFNEAVDGISFIQGDFLSLQQGEQYDVVVSLAAIEHVADVVQFIDKLRGLCKPHGLVILMTLNDRSILYASARILSRIGFQTASNRLYSKHHIHHFSTSSLRLLAEKAGLTIVKTINHNTPLAAVDFPHSSPVYAAIMKFGVWAAFALGKATGKTSLQTVICQK